MSGSKDGLEREERRRPWRTVIAVLVLLTIAGFLFREQLEPVYRSLKSAVSWIDGILENFIEYVDSLGSTGPIIFVLGYSALTVALVPGSFLTLAAGAVFGLVHGVVYVMIGASLGAAGAFLISRYIARTTIERRLQKNERFSAIDRAIGAHGLKITALLRLSPVFPFNFLNYALGLTRVRFLHYNLASLAMIPGSLLYVYYGSLIGDLASLADGEDIKRDGWQDWAIKITGLAATILVTAVVTRIARRALKEVTETSAPDDPQDAIEG